MNSFFYYKSFYSYNANGAFFYDETALNLYSELFIIQLAAFGEKIQHKALKLKETFNVNILFNG